MIFTSEISSLDYKPCVSCAFFSTLNWAEIKSNKYDGPNLKKKKFWSSHNNQVSVASRTATQKTNIETTAKGKTKCAKCCWKIRLFSKKDLRAENHHCCFLMMEEIVGNSQVSSFHFFISSHISWRGCFYIWKT